MSLSDTVSSIEQLRSIRERWRTAGERVAFVPTMGNLHDGHLALVERARACAQRTVVSIFVNPTQFGEGEDFDTYPRTLQADLDRLAPFDVDAVFVPEAESMYPGALSTSTTVQVHALADILEGEHRPGFFSGVATVVNKLFNIVQPEVAVFGEKDYQQLLVIRRMVDDLMMPVSVESVATAREDDGLAMSSRNSYFDAEQRRQATALYTCLGDVVDSIRQGGDANFEVGHACQKLDALGFLVDYVVVRRQSDMAVPEAGDRELVVLGAARLGPVRLIDNIPFNIQG